jgi:hypothetical protein
MRIRLPAALRHRTRYACQAGTIQATKATFHNLSQSADCTPYVASQCNGKASCTVTPSPAACNASFFDGQVIPNDYAFLDTTFSCTGTTQNSLSPNATAVRFFDQPQPNYITDADNVAASHFVAAPQPTVASPASFIDVTKHGIGTFTGTDQTTLIQTLIDSASDGTVFYFPKGWYQVTTLDFSRLKSFSIVGDARSSSVIAAEAAPAIKVDYASGAGSFQIHDMGILGGHQTGGHGIYAKNAVLSNLQDVSAGGGSGATDNGIYFENPFMDSFRSITTRIQISGGFHSTVEMMDSPAGYREWGTDHSNFTSRYEGVRGVAIEIGADVSGLPEMPRTMSFLK